MSKTYEALGYHEKTKFQKALLSDCELLFFAQRRVNILNSTAMLFRPGSRIRIGILWSSSRQGRLRRLNRQAKTRPRGMLGGGWLG